jgi:hypothetical protein
MDNTRTFPGTAAAFGVAVLLIAGCQPVGRQPAPTPQAPPRNHAARICHVATAARFLAVAILTPSLAMVASPGCLQVNIECTFESRIDKAGHLSRFWEPVSWWPVLLRSGFAAVMLAQQGNAALMAGGTAMLLEMLSARTRDHSWSC